MHPRFQISGWRPGARHAVVFMLFLGMANAYVMRTNMSVAIVAMVEPPSHVLAAAAASGGVPKQAVSEGIERFPWDSRDQGFVLSAFFYGYVLTQVPFGLMAKRWGARRFLGLGMLLNSVVGLFVPVATRLGGRGWLVAARFVQGLGEVSAQFGTVISLPLSGLLCASPLGWPAVFYVFGAIGAVWSIAFLWSVREDPDHDERVSTLEKTMIREALGDVSSDKGPQGVPWLSIAGCLPFWAILLAHMGHNYGYEMLMTELPSFMRQVLHVDITQEDVTILIDNIKMCRKIMVNQDLYEKLKINFFKGQFGPALALCGAAYAGCNPAVTVALLTLGVGLNGGIYSGFKVNHLDLSPRLAGVLMSITNCMANLAGLLAPLPTQAAWRLVFFSTCLVYLACGLFYLACGSGKRQPWDGDARGAQEEKDEEDEATPVGQDTAEMRAVK
ncbi:hypothetical protein B566_EDAN007103 [Ephemera danica]|nr:hypothetical protein B566_EDAN007103 [Ephemera danica]